MQYITYMCENLSHIMNYVCYIDINLNDIYSYVSNVFSRLFNKPLVK